MKFINYIFISLLFLTPLITEASESNGTIESGNKNALVCHSVDCVNPTPGIVNFLPTGSISVTINDINGIDGIAWGNEIGWINFDPTGAEGLTIDPNTGIITGKAWSQVSGWINFSVTGQSVKINNSGEFEGWAWTGGPYGGWIKFDCTVVGACVKTDWRPVGVRSIITDSSAVSQNSSGSSVSNDICPNLVGYQENVPFNYKKDEGGLCLLSVDYCKNIEGLQLSIPSSHVLNNSGQCVLLTDENKYEFIATIDNNGLSTDSQIMDYCSNLFGLQSKIPDGFAKNISDCFPKDIDYCPNFLGNQYSIPDNMKINNKGECVKMTKKEIVENNSNILNKKNQITILGYFFIPDFLIVPVVFPFVNKAFILGNSQIDLLSFLITIVLIVMSIFLIKKKSARGINPLTP